MMTHYDPREAKLPKWAIESLADARRRSDLGWPTIQRPVPNAVFDFNGHSPQKEAMAGQPAYHAVGGNYGGRQVRSVVFDAHGSTVRPLEGGGRSRPTGAYFLCERKALIAAWWEEADQSATRLHELAQKVREMGP